MRIEEIMSKPVVTCRPTDTLNSAARLMWENDCGIVAVIDENDRLTGVITDRDICMSAYTQGTSLHTIPVARAMAMQVFSCHARESIDAAERVMKEKQVRRVPIVDDDNRPIGLLSLNDIARHAAGARKKNGLDREVTQTLAAICQPHLPAVAQSQELQQRPQAAR